MDIIIVDEKTIGGVEREFQEVFPFLRVEFFYGGKTAEKSPESRIHVSKRFGELKLNNHPEHFTITPLMTVAEMESNIRKHYNILTRILRQSGKAWLETTLTDNWTLEEQNDQGRALSE